MPPAGPGTPAPNAAAAWSEATRACRDAQRATANVRVAFQSGRWRSSSLAVSVIVTASGNIRLDGPVFLLAGTAARAQLLLKDDGRIVTARADEIVDALVGVTLGPERLLAVLTGCVTRSTAIVDAAGFGRQIAVRTADGRVFLERRQGRWRAVAGVADGLTIDYRGFTGFWPGEWLAAPAAAGSSAVTLAVVVADLDVNPNDPNLQRPEAFEVQNAALATPMTLEELRAWRREGK